MSSRDGLFPALLRGEDDQHLERVAVGGDRVAAGLALQRQPVGEERLQGGGEGGHDSPFRWACSRSPASAISSGAADKYQYVCLGSV